MALDNLEIVRRVFASWRDSRVDLGEYLDSEIAWTSPHPDAQRRGSGGRRPGWMTAAV